MDLAFGGLVTMVGRVKVSVEGRVMEDMERLRLRVLESERGRSSESESEEESGWIGDLEREDLEGRGMWEMSSSSESESGVWIREFFCASSRNVAVVKDVLEELEREELEEEKEDNFESGGVLDFS